MPIPQYAVVIYNDNQNQQPTSMSSVRKKIKNEAKGSIATREARRKILNREIEENMQKNYGAIIQDEIQKQALSIYNPSPTEAAVRSIIAFNKKKSPEQIDSATRAGDVMDVLQQLGTTAKAILEGHSNDPDIQWKVTKCIFFINKIVTSKNYPLFSTTKEDLDQGITVADKKLFVEGCLDCIFKERKDLLEEQKKERKKVYSKIERKSRKELKRYLYNNDKIAWQRVENREENIKSLIKKMCKFDEKEVM